MFGNAKTRTAPLNSSFPEKKPVTSTPLRLRTKFEGHRNEATNCCEKTLEVRQSQNIGRGILRKQLRGKTTKAVSFDENVKEVAFERHSPTATSVKAFFKASPDAQSDAKSLTAGQAKMSFAAVLEKAEIMTLHGLTASGKMRLGKIVNAIVQELERLSQSCASVNDRAHYRALLDSHHGTLIDIAPQDYVDLGVFGAALQSLRLANEQRMTEKQMHATLADALEASSQQQIVGKWMGKMLEDVAQDWEISPDEFSASVVNDICQGWINSCRDRSVIAHFERQRKINAKAFDGENPHLADSIRSLARADQFDPRSLKSALLEIVDAQARSRHEANGDFSEGEALLQREELRKFCYVGQSAAKLSALVDSLASSDRAKVEEAAMTIASKISHHEFERATRQSVRQVQSAVESLKEVVERRVGKLKNATKKEKVVFLKSSLPSFSKVVNDVLDTSVPEFRHQLAMSCFGALSHCNNAIDEGSVSEFLAAFEELKTEVAQVQLRKPYARAAVESAVSGVLDAFVEADEWSRARTVVGWLAKTDSNELDRAFAAVSAAMQDQTDELDLDAALDQLNRVIHTSARRAG